MARNAQSYVDEVLASVRNDSDKLLGKDDLTIWGGHFNDAHLDMFLKHWTNFEWCFLECVSEFAVKKAANKPYAKSEHIERMRLFNTTMDLDIRRDGNTFHWRLIAIGSYKPLIESFEFDDFWDTHTNQQFLPVEQSHYQWRKGDDRVGLDLSNHFPNLKGGDTDPGIILKQVHYLHKGQTTFVRYIELIEEK